MPLFLWNYREHFKKLPPLTLIVRYGQRKWDAGINHTDPFTKADNQKPVFTMPTFGRHGRWGNIVFQYIFIRVFARQNNREIELNRVGESLNNRMNLYEDMTRIAGIKTRPATIFLDGYHIFPNPLNNIPPYMWRAMYAATVRRQQCFIIQDVDEAINTPLLIGNNEHVEVEGLFVVNPSLYKQQHKEYILGHLFQPVPEFKKVIEDCYGRMGKDKTIIGIHIRRGDFVNNPLDQMFQIPVPVRYINKWLKSAIPSFKDPIIYVCSDDNNAYKEIEKAGFEVVTTEMLKQENGPIYGYEQLEWEILRRCDVVVTSNSSFCFSATFLSIKDPVCYKFSFTEKTFVQFDPWESEPLQFCNFKPNLSSYLFGRIALVSTMVSKRSAAKRFVKDVRDWLFWKRVKFRSLYYIYGFSSTYFGKLFSLKELGKVYNKEANLSAYKALDEMKV